MRIGKSCKKGWSVCDVIAENGLFGNDEIARLLRLKRYEQPPPDYFENFLHEFRRRQRDELLRQPAWRICFERAEGFALQRNVRSLASYTAGISAAVACAAVISIRIYQQPQPAQVAVERLTGSKHTTSKCPKRIPPCASGDASDFQRRADSSAQKQGDSVATAAAG